ncbi:MAG UNVERIFIED_CONTAM: anacyclamide/piricyclamide family prenylated cyclic peptide [Microcystis novacekii LVE1205-3]|jgi:prenylated cyclic peptide (anacyclamide/piricyclamide family)
METKKLTPRNSAPVQRENTATVSRDGNAIAAPNEWIGYLVPLLLRETTARVIPPILARASNHVKSLFPVARVRGLPL